MADLNELMDKAFGKEKPKKEIKKHPIDDMMEPLEDQEEIIRKHPIGMLRTIHYMMFGFEPKHDKHWNKERIADKIIKELKK